MCVFFWIAMFVIIVRYCFSQHSIEVKVKVHIETCVQV